MRSTVLPEPSPYGATHGSTLRRAERWQPTLESSQRGYRLFSPLYDIVFGRGLADGRRVAIAALNCRAGERVLEVGIGSGLSLALYPKGVRLTGIDISREMLAKASRRMQELPIAATSELLRMDAGQMEFADASFDKAVMLFTVAGLPDPARALREVQRVCRPGAPIVIATHFRSQQPLLRACSRLLTPIYRMLRYRPDLDRDALIAAADLQVVESRTANLFGYATVLVCRNREAAPGAPRGSGST